MKRKILTQELANYLVMHAQCDLKEAENFARSFFDVIEQGLLQDKFVKIKGFGTFKLVAVSDRESVNINTGERFQINGHTKVSFTPDNAMKDLVNRPFAHFESVDLSDETDIKEFEEVDKQIEALEEKERARLEAQKAETTVAPKESNESDKFEEEKKNAEEKADKMNVSVVSVAPNEIADEDNASEDTLQQESEKPGVENDTDAYTASSADSEKEHSNQLPLSNGSISNEEAKQQQDAENEEIVVKGPNRITLDSETSHDSPYESKNFRYTYTESPARRKRNVWKTVALVLIVLLLMVLSYFAGYFRMLCPCSLPFEWSSANPEVIEAVPVLPDDSIEIRKSADFTDSVSNKANTAVPQATSTERNKPSSIGESKSASGKKDQLPPQKEKETKVKSDSSATTGTKPAYHTVRVGDNVYKISRKYYGSDKYVPAIIKLNKLRDANNIVIGKRLRLP